MKKDRVLKRILLLQALCMLLLAFIVVYRVLLPPKSVPQVPAEGTQGLNEGPVEQPGPIAAKVGDEQITVKQLNDQLRLQYGDSVLRLLMVRAATRMDADAYGLQVSSAELSDELTSMMAGYDSEDQYYAAMKEQLGLTPDGIREDTKYRLLLEKIAVQTADVSEAEVDAYIADNEAEFAPQTQLRLSWIVLKSKKEAEQLLDKLKDGEDFALMAKTYSIDANTASGGGDLGDVDADDPFLDPNVLQAATQLAVGDITGPIAVEKGQAIIRLTEKKTEGRMSQDQIRDKARRELAMSKLNGQRSVEDTLLTKYNAVVIP
ncbi:peptidylprolyl isomerase [Paenibacillus sp. R14(2021)]|uniref:peptidylprolyl isomerase n=1 Tax=Paenibacillus sp. R14(2021) TaxID=2859228 RepID=UPI001C613CB2|nr:peptidylprolyl isomerase [Paenibacillus sp. R14(2021)]